MDANILSSEKERLMTSRDRTEMKTSEDKFQSEGDNGYRARSNSAVIGGKENKNVSFKGFGMQTLETTVTFGIVLSKLGIKHYKHSLQAKLF